jgi:hypothetical protein
MADLSEEELLKSYKSYLKARGYKATKIVETASETPDLEVVKSPNTYLNEFKAPELILDPATGLYKFKTTNSKLLRFINKAVNQLESNDPSHEKPWVITCASTHFQLNWKNFSDALQGGVVFDGRMDPDFTKTAVFQKVLTKVYQADLYIWLQVNANEKRPYQATFILNQRSSYKELVEKMVLDLNSKPLSSMDNIVALS